MIASGIHRVAGPAPVAARRAVRSGGGFGLPAADAPPPDVEGAAPIVAGLLLQEEERRPRPSPRPALAEAEAAVMGFASLQIGLLGGPGRGDAQASLQQAASLPAADDPRLEEILRSIRLRARIELAREQAARPVTSLKSATDQPFDASFPVQKPLGMGAMPG